jgi:hypothetical protein
MGSVVVGSLLAGSACNPPYKQLLVGLGVGAGLLFCAGWMLCISDMALRRGFSGAYLANVPFHGSPGAPP